MPPADDPLRSLVAQWTAKAEQDFAAALRLLEEPERFRDVIAFLSQQAVEKYLKAFLIQHRVEFPKTHDLSRLLSLVATVAPAMADSLWDADRLTPFGVEIRYPGDAPEMLAGGESTAVEIARRVRESLMASLEPRKKST